MKHPNAYSSVPLVQTDPPKESNGEIDDTELPFCSPHQGAMLGLGPVLPEGCVAAIQLLRCSGAHKDTLSTDIIRLDVWGGGLQEC